MDYAAVSQAVKQQMHEEIGEQELNSRQRFGLLEKYGTLSPRFERFDIRITKPKWMEHFEKTQETEPWKKRLKNWRKAVEPLATQRLNSKKELSNQNSKSGNASGSTSTENGRKRQSFQPGRPSRKFQPKGQRTSQSSQTPQLPTSRMHRSSSLKVKRTGSVQRTTSSNSTKPESR